jgi:hypothetical protein
MAGEQDSRLGCFEGCVSLTCCRSLVWAVSLERV